MGRKVTITVPKKGEKERLVELAANNASMVLQKTVRKSGGRKHELPVLSGEIGRALDIPSIMQY